jgi:hypothetical protein
MTRDIVIPEAARPYLEAQRGAISDKLAEGHGAWAAALLQSYEDDFAQIKPALPDYAPVNVLDIGSGLGGIHIWLDDYFRTMAPGHPSTFNLLDGDNDPPTPNKNWMTHSNRGVALSFLEANGVHRVNYRRPGNIGFVPRGVDLVLSLQAWCFHLEPRFYLDQALYLSQPDTVFVMDVRAGRPEWNEQLASKLEIVKVLAHKPKYRRIQFRRKPA